MRRFLVLAILIIGGLIAACASPTIGPALTSTPVPAVRLGAFTMEYVPSLPKELEQNGVTVQKLARGEKVLSKLSKVVLDTAGGLFKLEITPNGGGAPVKITRTKDNQWLYIVEYQGQTGEIKILYGQKFHLKWPNVSCYLNNSQGANWWLY